MEDPDSPLYLSFVGRVVERMSSLSYLQGTEGGF